MEEKSKEEQLRIILQNYDKVREELETANAQIEVLYRELKQQKVLYKNMLDRYAGQEKTRSNTDLEKAYKKLQARYQKKCNECSTMLPYFVYMRDAIAMLYAKSEKICSKTEEFKGDESEEPQPPVNEKVETQDDKFVAYIRKMQGIYQETKGLGGISQWANKYGVTAITKVDFFEYGLNLTDVSDEQILKVYEKIKKR